jgi:IS30 family transposase
MAKRRERRVFTAMESAEVWDRWQRGEGLKLIGRVFGRTSSSISAHLKPHGGIRPVPRRRARRALSLDEREEISRGVAAGGSLRSIAAKLHRAPSTISRELQRNGGLGCHRAAAADQRAWHRALRPKRCKLARHDQLRQLVSTRLEENWSPEQIAGWLKYTYPDDEAYQVSHETIYRSLFVQARGVLKKDLMAEHKRFTLATDAAVHFCDPQSPWQRGSNENTNRLLRQYFSERHEPLGALTGAPGRDRETA